MGVLVGDIVILLYRQRPVDRPGTGLGPQKLFDRLGELRVSPFRPSQLLELCVCSLAKNKPRRKRLQIPVAEALYMFNNITALLVLLTFTKRLYPRQPNVLELAVHLTRATFCDAGELRASLQI